MPLSPDWGLSSPSVLEDHKLHPCAFYSRRLIPAEHNYDVGDRELLAVHAALTEWRHWREGAGAGVVGPPQPSLHPVSKEGE